MDLQRTEKVKILFLFLLLSFSLFASSFKIPTALDTDEQILASLSQFFKGNENDSYQRTIRRVGDNTIQFEAFIAMEADRKLMPKILSNLSRYNVWITPNINKSPTGKDYILKIFRFIHEAKTPNSVTPEFMLDLPGFRKLTTRTFNAKTEQKGPVFTLSGETPPDETSHIERATCQLKMFPSSTNPSKVWLYVKAKIKLRYWLLYEALPTRLLERESMERIQTVLDSYAIEEQSRLKK